MTAVDTQASTAQGGGSNVSLKHTCVQCKKGRALV